jgi:hypothetical protein
VSVTWDNLWAADPISRRALPSKTCVPVGPAQKGHQMLDKCPYPERGDEGGPLRPSNWVAFADGYLAGIEASLWECGDCGNRYLRDIEECPNILLDEASVRRHAARSLKGVTP